MALDEEFGSKSFGAGGEADAFLKAEETELVYKQNGSVRLRLTMSGITLRYQIKPSVLQIHKYHEPKEGAMDAVIEEPEDREEDQSVDRDRNLGCGERSGLLSGHCSYLRSSKTDKSTLSFSRLTVHPSVARETRSASTLSLKSTDVSFFCDWMPQMFGVDEDTVPSSEEEEVVLGGEDAAETEEAGPRYGRRARPKPTLSRKDGEEFECICDIDEKFDRQYVPHFGGGVKAEKDDWRVPHFSAYWEDYKEAVAAEEDASLMKLLEPKTGRRGEEEESKVRYQRPQPKFISPNVREARRQILESLRPLTCRELRRNRIPFTEAIILELEEDGYLETSEFLKSLLAEEYRLDQSREPCPTIRESKSKIQKLAKLLTAAERKGRKHEFNTQSIILLKTGKYFSDAEETWWWLAGRLFEKAVQVSSKYTIDGGKSEAIARYIYGMFLLDYAGKVRAAQEHLTRARELSLGREWNAERVLNKVQEPIYKECCNYLCRALIETSKQLRKEGKSEDALRFIHQSYKLCQESQTSKVDIELETLFELGMTYQDVGELEWAKSAFKKYVAKAKVEGYERSICDGHLELAICYRMEGEINHCHYHLKCYLEYASANNDENLKAFGNRYLGEFLLNHGHSKEAVPYFEKAFQSFLDQYQKTLNKPPSDMLSEELTLSQDVELARVLTGLAKGEILTKPICRLILRARDVRNQTDTLKLLKWKNSQEITFDIEEEDQTKQATNLLEDQSSESISMGELTDSQDSFTMEGFEQMENSEDALVT